MLSNWADVSKAGRMLGWEPRVGLRKGVKNIVDWYAAERSWVSGILTP